MLSLVHTGRRYTLYSRRFQLLYSRQNGDMVAENSRLPFWQLYRTLKSILRLSPFSTTTVTDFGD